ncbi:pectate lyase [Tothia fuscella]|uniref:Pectate lyase n=1 Tax=Tothia fuscella TaxID=1048955 RepID=A0A9P4TXE3_9PEZI|nr:pectate lyase [Tothia fuscella]
MTPNAIPTASSWPKPKGTQMLSAAKQVSGSFDGGLKLWDRSPGTCKSQKEGGDKEALFIIANGGTLSNVIVGSAQGEGIHCMGSCTLKNIWWEDVCEDAATFKQGSGTSFIIGGGAKKASDKVMQHNGGGTVHIKDYYADDVGKLYRSCGNCENNKKGRSVIVENSHVSNIKACAVGVNGNFGVKNSCIKGTVCNLFKGVVGHNQGKPSKTASEPDGKACVTQAVTSDC